MKTVYASLFVASLLASAGCNTSSTGGPGGAEGKFTLKGPSNWKDKELKHGESTTVEITIDANKEFKEDVALTTKVEPAEKGVTAKMESETVKASDPRKSELKITATDKAAAGEYTITVIGKPTKGKETNVAVKVKVPEKK